MRNFSKFEICPIAKAVSVLLSLAAATTLTQAGPGFGDAYDLNNTPFIIQSYFASSPAGTRQWTPILDAAGLPMNDATGKPMLAPAGRCGSGPRQPKPEFKRICFAIGPLTMTTG